MKRKIFVLLLAATLLFGLGAMTNARAAEPEMTVSQQFLDVLKKWEGFSATPYKDNGQYTFGYGCKCPSDQVDYYTENPLTEAQAEVILKEQLSGYEETVRAFASRYGLELQQHQFDALVSFTYNCGGTWVNDKTGYLNTAVRELNTGAGLIYGLGLWSSSAGRYILINRRMKEANMFINGQYDVVPDSYGWVYLNGGAGTTSYKIFCYDAGLKTPLNVEFKSVPTGVDANGKPFAYTLAGWYTESGTKVTVLDSSLSRGQTLYARWADPSGKIVTPTDQTAPQEGFPKTATVVNVSSTVNARVEPTTDSSKSGAIDAGSQVTVTEEVTGGTYSAGGVNSNIWCKLSDGRYVAKYYLRYAEESITGIRLIKQPAVTQYHQPVVSPKLEGSVLLVTYSDGSSQAMTVKKSMVSGFNGNQQGKQTVTITYGGKTTTTTVTVLPPLVKITAQPVDVYANAGSSVSITVKATGEGLTYTWYHKNVGEASFTKVSLTGATYPAKMSAASNGRAIYCVVRDKHGNSVTSKIATFHLIETGCCKPTLVKIGGVWKCMLNGKPYTANTLINYNGNWYHVKDGQWVRDTGFVKYNGGTYYVVDGLWSRTTTALIKVSDGSWVYVRNGVQDMSNTLMKFNGKWYHVSGGKWVKDTTMVKYDGRWLYVRDGVYTNMSTFVKYNGGTYYVKNGVYQNMTGFVNHNGTYYYLKNGVLDTTNSLVKSSGKWYHLVSGKWVRGTAIVAYNNHQYYVKNGLVDFTYTGKFAYNGRNYNIVKGVVK